MLNTLRGAANERAACDLVTQRIRAASLWGIPDAADDDSRTHLVSPAPFHLTINQRQELQRLGPALLKFYNGCNTLYLRSGHQAARGYLDLGKDDSILRQARMRYQKAAVPRVIRPDILPTQDGFVITELDSVPGGMGHLECLCQAYQETGSDLIGSAEQMREGFWSAIREESGTDDPVCAMVVSDESADYLPEMQWLAKRLREDGLAAYTVHPRDVAFAEDGLSIDADGRTLRVDVVYRFFELFDLLNVPKSELIAYAARKKLAVVTPPFKHYLEEKLLLALLHLEALEDFWSEEMGADDFALLKKTVSPTYILDPRPVPPHAQISGFTWRGKPIRDWMDIACGTQRERRLVIKPSGFSPLAWGSRGVKIGHDMSQEDWHKAVADGLASFETSPHVLQPFREALARGVRYYDEAAEEVREMKARVRLCPYYFVTGNQARLSGVLATACPHNKKIIHGMQDAVMMPCSVEDAAETNDLNGSQD